MFRTRLATLGFLTVVFTSWHGLNRAELEGEWEIVSVERDAVPDSTPIGARVTFTGNAVTFRPRPTGNGVDVMPTLTMVRSAILDGTR